MKKIIFIFLVSIFTFNVSLFSLAEDSIQKPKVEVSKNDSKYSINVSIKDIPAGQQTLFIPIDIDTRVLDFDKVALEGLSSQNILAVASNSKDKVGTGIGLLKLDNKGLPETLSLKVLLKQNGEGRTSVDLVKVAPEPALPSKGTVLNKDVKVTVKTESDFEVVEKIEGVKKRLVLDKNKLTLEIVRPSQKEESIFIPIIVSDTHVLDIDETFGHAIVAPGIAAKSFSFGSLHEGGPGVEILLSEVAEKDFTIDVDLISRKVGKTKVTPAFPQSSHTALVRGPSVEISPTSISVVSSNVVVDDN